MIEWNRFVGDFMYNYEVAPAYGGQHGHGYGLFLKQFPEILGWPGSVAIWIFLVASLVIVLHPRWRQRAHVSGFLLIGSFFVLYYLKIGAFARLPTRFVLPAIPFVILMAGPLLCTLRARWWIFALLIPITVYNVVCSVMVGQRFASDPRLGAQSWMLEHLARGQLVESSPRGPYWAELTELDMIERKAANPDWRRALGEGKSLDLRMPAVNGRSELFGRLFKGNRWV